MTDRRADNLAGNMQTDRQACRQSGWQAGKHAGRQASDQTDRQKENQAVKHRQDRPGRRTGLTDRKIDRQRQTKTARQTRWHIIHRYREDRYRNRQHG